MNTGLVTIGIPTRNRSGYLVNSVRSALAQTYARIEVVVSDNASTDDTALRMQEFDDPRLVYLRQSENLGMIGNFNACLQAASGGLFLMLSDDDLLEPEAIEQLSRPFQQVDADIGITWCPCVITDPKGEPRWTTQGGPPVEGPESLVMELFNGNRGPRFCSVMVRTADALAVGGYSGQRHGSLCDTANWTQTALRHKAAACIDRPLVKNMVHAGTSSGSGACRDWQAWGKAMFADLRKSLRDHGASEKKLRSTEKNLLANLTVTILLPNVGRPGWVIYLLREIARAWRIFLTVAVARRLMRESWKILRFWQRERLA